MAHMLPFDVVSGLFGANANKLRCNFKDGGHNTHFIFFIKSAVDQTNVKLDVMVITILALSDKL